MHNIVKFAKFCQISVNFRNHFDLSHLNLSLFLEIYQHGQLGTFASCERGHATGGRRQRQNPGSLLGLGNVIYKQQKKRNQDVKRKKKYGK